MFFSLYSILASPPSQKKKKIGEFGVFCLRWKWLLEIVIDNKSPAKEIACSPSSSSTKEANQNTWAAEAAGLIHGEAQRSSRSVPNTVIHTWYVERSEGGLPGVEIHETLKQTSWALPELRNQDVRQITGEGGMVLNDPGQDLMILEVFSNLNDSVILREVMFCFVFCFLENHPLLSSAENNTVFQQTQDIYSVRPALYPPVPQVPPGFRRTWGRSPVHSTVAGAAVWMLPRNPGGGYCLSQRHLN